MFDKLTIDFTSEELKFHWYHVEKSLLICTICKKLENLKRHVQFIAPKESKLQTDLKTEKV